MNSFGVNGVNKCEFINVVFGLYKFGVGMLKDGVFLLWVLFEVLVLFVRIVDLGFLWLNRGVCVEVGLLMLCFVVRWLCFWVDVEFVWLLLEVGDLFVVCCLYWSYSLWIMWLYW